MKEGHISRLDVVCTGFFPVDDLAVSEAFTDVQHRKAKQPGHDGSPGLDANCQSTELRQDGQPEQFT